MQSSLPMGIFVILQEPTRTRILLALPPRRFHIHMEMAAEEGQSLASRWSGYEWQPVFGLTQSWLKGIQNTGALTQTRTQTYICTNMHTQAHTHAYKHTQTQTCTHTLAHAQTDTHSKIYKHTHLHMNPHKHPPHTFSYIRNKADAVTQLDPLPFSSPPFLPASTLFFIPHQIVRYLHWYRTQALISMVGSLALR